MIRLLLLLVLPALLACKSGQSGVSGKPPLVELKTGGCFGYCPVIRLTVQQNGLVEYEGMNFAERMGRDSFRLTKAEYKLLRRHVVATNLWQYPDRIKSDVVDAPMATLTVFEKNRSKQVTGSIDRPEPLLALENRLKDLAETHGFNVRHGINPKEPPLSRRREVVVTLKPELNAGNWIRQFSDYRLLLIRRLSQENAWIVAYDPEQIDEKGLIGLFKKSDGVLDAKPNPQN